MKGFLAGATATLLAVAAVVAALLLFTDVRVTDQSAEEEASHLLLDGQPVQRCCGKPPSVSVPNEVGNSVGTARSDLEDAGLKTRIESPRLGQHKGLGPDAVVQNQIPSADTLASPGVRVTLFVMNE